MAKEDRRRRIEYLEEEIRSHRQLYYAGTPRVSDAEFDALEDELRELAPESRVLAEVGAPPDELTRVSGAGLPTKAHKIPMGSLEKVTDDKLENWAAQRGDEFLVQEKLDGISMELEYEDGKLVDAITRGDGYVGEVVTHNAVSFRNVERELNIPFSGSVRGEVVLRLSDFERYFVGRNFANPRNTVSGTVRKKHGDRSLNQYFEMMFYDVIVDGVDFSSEDEKMAYLTEQLELPLAPSHFDCSVERIREIYDEYQGQDGKPGRRFELDYEIDGLVVRANQLALQAKLGWRGNRPRFAVAFKFPSEGKTTALQAIDWSVGLSGRVTPVARLEPVEIAGVQVSNASLHNADYVEALDVRLGDLVLVERKGDVIPKVMRLVERRGTEKPVIPTSCPSCYAELEFSGKHLSCPNPSCPEKSFGDIYRWIQEMEIDALGEKWVRLLIEHGLVDDPADLYTLTVDRLLPLPRMGQTLAKKIVNNIDRTRRPTLDRFVAALNVREFSRQRAQMLIDAEFDTLEKMQAATVSELAAVKGFGDVLAERAVHGLEARRGRIDRLLGAGIQIAPPEPRSHDGTLTGATFCFTGAIARTNPATGKTYKRKEMEAIVKAKGGKAVGSVTQGLDYLVMVDPGSTSTKAQKARKLGTKILSEEEFFELVGEA